MLQSLLITRPACLTVVREIDDSRSMFFLQSRVVFDNSAWIVADSG